jgi:hypothetical protein
MTKATDADDGDALVRLGIGEAKAAPDGVTGTENGRSLLVADSCGQGHGGVGIGEHVFGVAALKIDAGGSGVLAQLFLAAQTPLAGAVSFLNPADADAVSDFAGGDAGADFDDLADGLVAEHARKLHSCW